MINKFILMFIPILIIGCTSQPDGQKEYEHKDLGIKIVIPNNWKQVSADEAGQENADPESDLLRLGFFDPKTGEKEGIFVLSKWGKLETKQEKEEFQEAVQELDKIVWNNHTCYFDDMKSEKGTKSHSYVVIKDNTVLGFFIGYTKSFAEPATNILKTITF